MKYEAKLEKLINWGAHQFKECDRNESALLIVLTKYMAFGMKLEFTPGELIDFLGVSTPSILGLAGYTDSELIYVMELLSKLSDEEIKNYE